MRPMVMLALLLWSAPAWAHGIESADSGWTIEPWVVVSLAISGALYARGYRRLPARSHHGPQHKRRNMLLFAGGWFCLAVALLSPLPGLSGRVFYLHMVEHEIIMMLAAPLLALSRPLAVMLWAFPRPWRRSLHTTGKAAGVAHLWRWLTHPVTATAVQAATLWFWHLPGPFEAALASEAVHTLQHACFLIAALLFWWTMAYGRFGRNAYGFGALCLFATSIQSSLLGALLAVSRTPWYPSYAAHPSAGLSAIEDQQLAGLIMWVPAGLVHAGAAFVLIALWLKHAGRPTRAEKHHVVWTH
jgi:putative membrane protein